MCSSESPVGSSSLRHERSCSWLHGLYSLCQSGGNEGFEATGLGRPDVGKLTGHHPYPWPGACAGALNQTSWSTCRNPWRTSDVIRTTRRHLASGWRSCRDLKWLDLAASGLHFHTSHTHFMEESNMFSVKKKSTKSLKYNLLYGRYFNIHKIT